MKAGNQAVPETKPSPAPDLPQSVPVVPVSDLPVPTARMAVAPTIKVTAVGLNESALPIEQIVSALKALRRGDFEVRLPSGLAGASGVAASTFNDLAETLARSTEEMNRVSRSIGREGKLQERLPFGQDTGAWAERVNAVNMLIDSLAHPITETARVIDAVAAGDLSAQMALEIGGHPPEGEFLRLAQTVNCMVNQLRAFASEVNRVAREVGTEGKLGGQANVERLAGAWKDNINQMIRNLRETTHTLENRITALTDINRELEAFNYSISHDLRAPLRSMSSFAQALLDQEGVRLDAEGMDFARRIRRSALHMDTLLQDLLTYSRLSRTEMPLLEAHLDEAVNEVLANAETDLQKIGGTVELVAPLGTALAHPPTLKQILANLIDNAIKFASNQRPLHLRIFAAPQSGFVRLWVEDNGIGIAREHHEKIFGLFQRLHRQDTYPGTGVGLALVRKGAERMGGRSGVESQPGQGSRFWVDLPAADGALETGKEVLVSAFAASVQA